MKLRILTVLVVLFHVPIVLTPSIVAQKRRITIEDLVTLRRPHSISVSPDGRYTTFLITQAMLPSNNFFSELFLLRTDGTHKSVGLAEYVTVPQLTQTGALVETGATVLWAPDSQQVLYTKQNGSKFQIWRRVVEDETDEMLVHDQPPMRLETWFLEGRKFIYSVFQEVVEKEQPKAKTPDPAVLFDGTRRLWRAEPWEKTRRKKELKVYRLFTLATQTEEEIDAAEISKYLPPDPPIFEYPKKHPIWNTTAYETKWSPDRRFTAFLTQFVPDTEDRNAHSEFGLTVRTVAQEAPLRHLFRSERYISEFLWSADGKKIYFTVLEPDHTTLYAAILDDGSIQEIFKTQSRLTELSWARSEKIIICRRGNPVIPPEIVRLDLAARKTTTLVAPNFHFSEIELPTPRLIRIKNNYGHEMWGQLVLPNDYEQGKRYPLVITTYRAGTRFLEGAVGNEFPIYVYAANGFAVFALDVGASIFPSQKGNLEQTLLRVQSPLDTLHIVRRKLAEEGLIDPNRIGITGLSFGSEIVAYAIANSEVFQVAASTTDGHGPITYYLDNKHWEELFQTSGHGFPDEDGLKAWKKVSAALNADRIRTPLLLQPPDSEMLTTIHLYKSMKHYGVPVEMFVYPNEGHVKMQPISKYWVYQRNLDWMMFWLQGKEDPDPSKAEQYVRWRELRELHEENQRELPANETQ